MTTLLFSSTLIFILSKDFLRGVEQCAQRGTIPWNIFFCVEHFRGTIFQRGTFWANYLQNPVRCCKWLASTGPGPVIASNLQELIGIASNLQLDTIYYIAKKTALYITI
jgi:hypothetical protein